MWSIISMEILEVDAASGNFPAKTGGKVLEIWGE